MRTTRIIVIAMSVGAALIAGGAVYAAVVR